MRTITGRTLAAFTVEDFRAAEEAITRAAQADLAGGRRMAQTQIAAAAAELVCWIVREEQGRGLALESYAGDLGLALIAIGYSFAHLELERAAGAGPATNPPRPLGVQARELGDGLEAAGAWPVEIHTDLATVTALLAHLQLALRHPGNTGPSAAIARSFGRRALEVLIASEAETGFLLPRELAGPWAEVFGEEEAARGVPGS